MRETGLEPAPLAGLDPKSSNQMPQPAGRQTDTRSALPVLPTGLPKTGESPAKLESDLRLIVDRWPALPDAVKAGIVAMVRLHGSDQRTPFARLFLTAR